MLCYVMLWYAMLCYAKLCYAMQGYDMLCYDLLCYDENRDRNMCQLFAFATQRKKLAHVTESAESVTCASLLPLLCYAMLCYAMPCHAMPCYAPPHAMLSQASSGIFSHTQASSGILKHPQAMQGKALQNDVKEENPNWGCAGIMQRNW